MNTNPDHNIYPASFDPTCQIPDENRGTYSKEYLHALTTGLTKREYFAAMAMQGLMAVDHKGELEWDEAVKVAARYSVAMANALINELNKES